MVSQMNVIHLTRSAFDGQFSLFSVFSPDQDPERITPGPRSRKAGFLFPFIFFLMLFLWAPETNAASQAVITSCRLTSGTRFKISATIKTPKKVPGKKIYLFSLLMTQKSPSSSDKPIASVSKKKNITFKVRFRSGALQEVLSRKYVIAARKSNGSYVPLCRFHYITDASSAASYKYAFPEASSKKGLQVKSEMMEDAQELNVSHSVINIVFTEMLASSSEQNSYSGIPFTFEGKTYWFRRSAIQSYDSQLKALTQNGVLVYAVLLLGYRDDCLDLIYPGARETGHSFYAWNCREEAPRKTLQAVLSFLAGRYSARNGSNGRIVGWIVGNEVNNYNTWNYAGKQSLSSYAVIYANAFRLTYNAVTSVYSNARVYISLDHLWNTKLTNYFTARQMLDAFASCIKRNGYIQWNLAYHPYGSPLTEPKFWENKNRQTTNSLSSPVINMNNLGILTNYIRTKYGSNTRVILSEQGYTSRTSSKDTQKEQAAAIVYSYYLTEADSMVDAFIMNRHVDHTTETSQGLNLGLWTTEEGKTESADSKKTSWNLYKYMDTPLSGKVSESSLKVIGASSWSRLIDGFTKKLYQKKKKKKGTLKTAGSYKGGKQIPVKWRGYGAFSEYSRSGKTMHVVRLSDANKNRLWGISQSFRKGINLSKTPQFAATVKVDGAASGKAYLKIRFYSGKKIFECERKISTGTVVHLKTSLKNWSGKNKITKIMIMAAPYGGGWYSTAAMTISNVRRIA